MQCGHPLGMLAGQRQAGIDQQATAVGDQLRRRANRPLARRERGSASLTLFGKNN